MKDTWFSPITLPPVKGHLIKKDTFNVFKVPLVSLYAVGVCTRKITYLHVAGMNDISQIISAAPSIPVIDIDYLHPGFIIATLSPLLLTFSKVLRNYE